MRLTHVVIASRDPPQIVQAYRHGVREQVVVAASSCGEVALRDVLLASQFHEKSHPDPFRELPASAGADLYDNKVDPAL